MTDQVHRLGEVLRAAREAKGVDLQRVERETKIRERYLSALERGEYRELPGSVYTKGFLRNYGAYLGLDPEYLIDLYRLETTATADRPSAPTPPRPLAGRRSRAFVVTPGAVVAGILTILVGGFIAYLGYEFVNFARTPELRITDPAGNVNRHPDLAITIRGITAPNARVSVSNLTENPTVTADADGAFEVTVRLVPGSNVARLTARDPVTNRDSEVEERTIVVSTEPEPSASDSAVALEVNEPADGAEVTGEMAIGGTGRAGAAVTVSAVLVEAPVPTFTVTDAADQPIDVDPADPTPPEPLALTTDSAGVFTGSLSLAPGRWELTVVTDGSAPVVRTVTVGQPSGLRATLMIDGGDSYVELDEDGVAAEESGSIAAEGDEIGLEAEDDLRIRVGNAGAVRVTVNGVSLGGMGGDGAVVEWRIQRVGG
ncbi:MAG TPA: RodZ domain-containing protein [Patescibacteria group bacterium]|nr:RodZ domain-containing protein [Patescibacteria group bacterium]